METKVDIAAVLEHWGLSEMTATPIYGSANSTWEIGGRYVLKHNPNPGELAGSLQLTGLLAAEGIPVATHVRTRDGGLTTPDGKNCLMTKLRGEVVDLYRRRELAAVLGGELARLHVALARIEPRVSGCCDNDLLAEWKSYIAPGIAGEISGERIAYVEEGLLALYPALPRQLIHRDVHLNNLLFEEDRLSGWLDFDLRRRDARLFDIVYLLGSLQPEDRARAPVWSSICGDILAGYERLQPLSPDERKALPVLLLAEGLLFVAFWGDQGNQKKRREAAEAVDWLFQEDPIR